MQATSSCSLVLLPKLPFVSHKLRPSEAANTRRNFTISASTRDSYDHHYGGKLVDENMILLRLRIRDIEMEEMKMKTPTDWTEWEKKYFANYGSDVCEAVGLLQRFLMNTRPSLAVGMVVLIMLSLSMSMSQLVFHLVELIGQGNHIIT